MTRGGKRSGAGRKPKADEVELIEKLSPLDERAFDALEAGIEKGDYLFVKLFFEYRFGKPQNKVDITTDGEEIKPINVTLNLG